MKKINNIAISIAILLILIGCERVTPLNNARVSTMHSAIGNINLDDSISNIDAQKIYSKCSGCHGKNGEKSALGKSQIIGGEDKEALLYQLQEYKAGRLNQYGMGQLMKGQVAGLTYSELELVSEYISKLSGI